MARHGENIRKRKDGRWEGRYKTFDEKRGKYIYRSVYGKDYVETKENSPGPGLVLSVMTQRKVKLDASIGKMRPESVEEFCFRRLPRSGLQKFPVGENIRLT